MDDFDSDVIRLIRAATAQRRGYADFFGWPLDRDMEELGIAETLCEALAAAGQPLASCLTSRGRGNDPPDCEGAGPHGTRIGIEATELVDPNAIVAAKQGRTYDWAEWTPEKLCRTIQERLSSKDSCTLRGGPYDAYVVVIHTDEPELTVERIRELLGSARFEPTAQVDRAFLLLSYDPKAQTYPAVELPLPDT